MNNPANDIGLTGTLTFVSAAIVVGGAAAAGWLINYVISGRCLTDLHALGFI
jgi:hypothetical protein